MQFKIDKAYILRRFKLIKLNQIVLVLFSMFACIPEASLGKGLPPSHLVRQSDDFRNEITLIARALGAFQPIAGRRVEDELKRHIATEYKCARSTNVETCILQRVGMSAGGLSNMSLETRPADNCELGGCVIDVILYIEAGRYTPITLRNSVFREWIPAEVEHNEERPCAQSFVSPSSSKTEMKRGPVIATVASVLGECHGNVTKIILSKPFN